MCYKCDAYTGVHKSSPTFQPLGTLAKKELRALRSQVHALFDPLWKNKKMSRNEAYAWLSEQLNIPSQQTHVAMFDETRCRRAIQILKSPF